MAVDVFLSYKREEQTAVRAIAAALEANGYSVWWDPQLEASSRAYPKQIWDALTTARGVIVVWSKLAIESDWVTGEATEARARQTLIQIRIDDVSLRPPFNMLECIDLQSWSGSSSDRNWMRLLAQVHNLCGAKEMVPQKSGAAPTRYDVSSLHHLVADAVLEARAAQREAQDLQQRARAAAEAGDRAAARARGDAFGTHIGTYPRISGKGTGEYQGEGFVDSHGSGVWTVKDGDVATIFRGQFVSGRQEGLGTIQFNGGNSLRYEGEFLGGRVNGFGIWVWRDGDTFHGRFVDGKATGFGVFHWQQGRRYEGEVVNFQAHGYGVNWNADGLDGDAGHWEEGTLVAALTL